MTEEEWLTSLNFSTLLHHATMKGASPRKFRLLMVAWFRFAPHMALDPRVCEAADLAERFADDRSLRGVVRGFHGGFPNGLDTAYHCLTWPYQRMTDSAAMRFAHVAGGRPTRDSPADPQAHDELFALRRVWVACVHCLFGNPFRPVAFADAWRTETAVALATGIYEDRAFDRLPILADVLEEAGCDHADVLSHCRGPGPHARGCWGVDLVLSKT
jgi:hypothetical protein